MEVSPSPRQNKILASLPSEDYDRIFPHLKLVSIPLDTTLYDSSKNLNHAYFPITSIVSLASILDDGTSIEFALVGNEGVIGISLFMGCEATATNRAIVLSEGLAYQMNGSLLTREFSSSNTIRQALLHYTQTLISQIAQTAVCNRHHSLDKQLCRLLLLIVNRLPSNEINMTQELIANTLGVRREGITEAAGKLQKAGLIQYSRGHIIILNKQMLEKRACECYHIIKNESHHLFPNINSV